ncbi:hypothetical protein NBRC116592_22380 [Colwellia sp. KU-HH00111]|uniref:tetratricopeptide repeat protein n=1 Tax=Colwellia sp. KU-HH00111 TaxID=3127652 RepID=UPI00310C6792
MFNHLIRMLIIIFITVYSFSSFSLEVPACQSKQCKQYFKDYKKYSKSGYADAMTTLGDLYLNGHGTKKDFSKAFKQYKMAAKYGSVTGQHKAAMIYLNNEKYKDIAKGIKYLEKAARAGSSEAAFVLSVIFYKEDFHEQDFSKSDKWLTKAYKANHKNSSSFIQFIKNSNNLTVNNYPKLHRLLSDKPLPTKKIETAPQKKASISEQRKSLPPHKDDDIEVITVTANLHSMFDVQIASLKNTYPQKGAVATGTRILGKSCDEMLSCSTIDQGQLNLLINNIMGAGSVSKFYP